MTSNIDLVESKEKFLLENPSFTEIELTDDSKPVGKLDDFDLLENEIWLLQCPKNMNVNELQNQKIKMPGRSNINGNEAVSMEFEKGKECHAFAYCNRKGSYVLRLLPVRGTIVVRDRLKAAETVSEERVEECSSPAKRVPVPKVRIRHPLLGSNYEDKIKLDESIEKRLKKADENSAQILNETLKRKSKQQSAGYEKTTKNETKLGSPIEINSGDDDVEFVSEEKLKKKKKKNKRKQSKYDKDTQKSAEAPPTKRSNSNDKEYVSEDLQWLQTI